MYCNVTVLPEELRARVEENPQFGFNDYVLDWKPGFSNFFQARKGLCERLRSCDSKEFPVNEIELATKLLCDGWMSSWKPNFANFDNLHHGLF
jgi:hypothetical protein